MTTKSDLIADLQRAGLAPNKKLGQNFMVDQHAVAALIAAADLPSDNPPRIVEIGPGTGLLTDQLLQAGHRVIAVELDRGLAGFLRDKFADNLARDAVCAGSLRLIEGDCLASKQTLNAELLTELADQPWALVANLPYEPSLPVLLNSIALPNQPQRISVTINLKPHSDYARNPVKKRGAQQVRYSRLPALSRA